MGYSFKDDVIARLPAGHTFVRMYSTGDQQTSVETSLNGVKNVFIMEKVDLSTYFFKMPTIALEAGKTFNDLYEKISDLYSLGMQRNVDFYNSDVVEVGTTPRFFELPISRNSYGYSGIIRCFVIECEFSGSGSEINNDISGQDLAVAMSHLKFRNFLAGNLFQTDPPLFIENHLSAALIDKITANLDEEIVVGASDTFREELSTSTVVDVFSDGLSDIAVLLTSGHDLYHLRFKSEPNDLPIIKNGNSDVKTDDSKELPVGEGGNVNTGEQSELPNSSTEGELVTDDDLELEIE